MRRFSVIEWCGVCVLVILGHGTLTMSQENCVAPVDCVVSDWVEFSPCTASCGTAGVQTRTRTILQAAKCGGSCDYNVTETRTCNRQCCPKNCVYSSWTSWFQTGKSVECDLPGERPTYSRERRILEDATCGGYCDYIKAEEKCGDLLCSKNCALSRWSVWSPCQAPCEQKGVRYRTKKITQEPECGGEECGVMEEEEQCVAGCCPIDCQLGPWSAWSVCDVTCGKANQTRSRFVQQPECGGAECPEGETETDERTCENYVNVDCMVGPWSAWTDCVLNNGFCGSGTENRTRKIVVEPECQGQECPPLTETRECYGPCCRQDCVVSEWSEWAPCSTTCGVGISQRTREVTVENSCNGTECPRLIEQRDCNVTKVINCELSQWTEWSNCSTDCGAGKQYRDRTLLTPAYCGGSQCSSMVLEEERDCESYSARRDCQVTDWLEWGECVRDCEQGTQIRNRSILENPECGGTPCPSLQTSEWGSWLECVRDCSGGMQKRYRTIVQAEQCGGKSCHTLGMRTCHERCSQLCKNGVCSCRKEYYLLPDGYSCTEIQCPPVPPKLTYCPPNHKPLLDCTVPQIVCKEGYKYNANCSVNCDNRGSQWTLKGDPKVVTCLSTRAWSQPEIYCGLPNKAPHSLTVDKTRIEENTLTGACVIYMNVKDNAYDKARYEIVKDSKGLFYVDGNRLCLTRKADFEEKPTKWNVTIRARDLGNLTVDAVFEFEVLNENDPPTAVIISRDTIPENSPVGTEVGCLSGRDDDPGQNVSLALVNSDKELFTTYRDDNGALCIKVAKASDPLCSTEGGTYCQLNMEKKDHHMITIMAVDDGNPPKAAYFDLKIKLSDVNDRPTGIKLDPVDIPEEVEPGKPLVAIVTVDEDEKQTYTYRLIDNSGGLFQLKGGNLTSTRKFDYENTQDQGMEFTISINSTDNGQPPLSVTSSVTFRVADVNEKPYDLILTSSNAPIKFDNNKPKIKENANAVIVGTMTAKDHDAGDDITLLLGDGSDARLSIMNKICSEVPGLNIYCMAALVSFGSFNYESEPVLNLTLRAVDKEGLEANTTIQLEVLNMNDPPTDILLDDSNVTMVMVPENSNDYIIGVLSAVDEDDDDTHQFYITSSDGDQFIIEDGVLKSSRIAGLDFETAPFHDITVLVEDSGSPKQSFQKVFRVDLLDVNEAPSDILLSNNQIKENSLEGTVVGTLSGVDPENSTQTLTFTLSDDGRGRFRVVNNELQVKKSSLLCSNRPCELDFETEPKIDISVKVTDNGTPPLSYNKTFTITLTDDNDPPRDIRLAGNSVRENAPGNTIVGKLTAVEQDPGQTLTFDLLNHTDIFDLSDDFTLATKAPLNHEVQGVYYLSIKATDDGQPAAMTTSAVLVSVLDINEMPDIEGPLKFTVKETMETGAVIGQLTATDLDKGENLGLTIQSGRGFSLKDAKCSDEADAGSKCTTSLIVDTVLDYETQDTYTLAISVTDKNGLNNVKNVIIMIEDENDAPRDILVDGQPLSDIHVSEDSQDADIAELSALDDDTAQQHSFVIVDGAEGIFEIVNNKLRVKKDADLDYETRTEYEVKVKVTDDGSPAKSYNKTFTLLVDDVNEAPAVLNIDASKIAENSGENKVIGSFSVEDPDNIKETKQTFTFELLDNAGGRFKVSGKQLQVAQSNTDCLKVGGAKCHLNYEESANHIVTVLVSDSGVPSQSTAFNITIEILDQNDRPTNLQLSGFKVEKSAPIGTEIGQLSVTDEDTSQSHTFSLVSDGQGRFAVSPEGSLTKATEVDLDPKVLYMVTVKAVDSGDPQLEITADFTITAIGGNEAPTSVTFTSTGGPITFDDNKPTVQENTTTGTMIGSLVAMDTGLDQKLTFSVRAKEGETPVEVKPGTECTNQDGDTRCIATVSMTKTLDYEAVRQMTLIVTVTDGDGMNLVELFPLTVQDVNEAPADIEYSGGSISVHEKLNNEPLGVFTVKDPDNGDTHKFKLTNENAEKFVTDSTGRLSTAAVANLDFETTPTLAITVQVTDKGGLTYQKTFTVSVSDVNEKPQKILLSANQVPEMSPVGTKIGTLSVLDPDGGQTFTFDLIDDAGGRVSLKDNVLKVAGIGADCQKNGGSACLFDFESATSHNIVVKVTDSGQPSMTLTSTLTLDVMDVNDPPTDLTLKVEDMQETVKIGETVATLQASDEDGSQTLTYILSGGQDMFLVTGNTIVLDEPLNYEAKSSYTITITAVDNGAPVKNITKDFTLNVINVNEAPYDMNVESSVGRADFNTNQPIIEENSPLDSLIGQVVVLDPDSEDDIRFSTSSTDVALFNQKCFPLTKGMRCTADIRTAVVFDYETQKSSNLVFVATDKEGLSVQREITLTITDANDPPKEISLSGPLLVPENSQDVTLGRLSATDPDTNQIFTFSITSDTQDYYIAGDQLKVSAGADLNFEERSSDMLRLKVTDSGQPPRSFEKKFTINIEDVNEKPANIRLSRNQVPEDSMSGLMVGTLSADDPDNLLSQRQTLTYALADQSQSRFMIEGNSFVVSTADFDYESIRSYTVNVQVSDSGSPSLTSTAQLTIHITDANDPPTDLKFSAKDIAENSDIGTEVGTLTSRDQDVGQTVSYSLQSSKYFTVSDNRLLVGGTIDFEATPTITFSVNATDDGIPPKMISRTFTVKVTDANDAPSDLTFNPSADIVSMAIPESTQLDDVLGTVEVTDVDAVDSITFEVTENTNIVFKLSSTHPSCVAWQSENEESSHRGTKCVTKVLMAKILNYEDGAKEFTLGVKVKDKGGQQLTKKWTFTVANSNEPPRNIILDGNISTIPENTPDFLLGALVTEDEDKGDNHIYQVITHWEVFHILKGNMLGAKPGLDYEQKSVYNVTIRSTDDGKPPMSYDKVFSFMVSDENEKPTDITVVPSEVSNSAAVGDVVGLIKVTDPDNHLLNPPQQTHTCTVGGDGANTFTVDGSPMKLKVSGEIPVDVSELTVRLICKDDGTPPQELDKEVKVTVKETVTVPKKLVLSNQKKVPENAESFVVGEFQIVNMISNEPIKGFFLYMIIGFERPFSLEGSSLKTTKPFDYETQPTVELTVKGVGKDIQGKDVDITTNFMIEVEDVNEAPTGISIYGGGRVRENSASGTKIGNLHTEDQDGDQTYTYKILAVYPGLDKSAAKPEYMELLSLGGSMLSVDTATSFLDFEQSKMFSVDVMTTDSGLSPLSYTGTVRLVLEDENDPPSDITLSNTQIAENNSPGASVGELSVTDQDKDQRHDCVVINRVNVPFQIKSNFSLVVGNKALDYEETRKYSVEIECRDFGQDGSSLRFRKMFVIDITNVNEPPSDISLSAMEIAENNLVGQVVGEISAKDLDSDQITFSVNESSGFKLQGDNTLVANQVFHFEKTPEVEVTVTATDGEGLSSSKKITIKIIDMNEAPTDILLDKTMIKENLGPGTVIGRLSTVDQDRGQEFTYTVTETGQDTGFIDIRGDKLVTGSRMLDFEKVPQIKVSINSTDNGSPPKTYKKEFILTVTDAEEPPLDIIMKTDIKVKEDTPPSTVLTAIQVDDPDLDQSHVCQNANSSTPFSVVTNENKDMNLVLTGALDFESVSSYKITVRCSDGTYDKEKTLTISVVDVNEAPMSISLSADAVKADAAAGHVIGELQVTEPDIRQTHTLTVQGPNSDILQIKGNSLVLTSKLPESELSQPQPTFVITVLAADNGNPSLSVKQTFKLPITDVEIVTAGLPSITIGNSEVPEDAKLGYQLGEISNFNGTLAENIVFELTGNPNEVFKVKDNRYIVLDKNLTAVEGKSRKITIRVKNTDTLESESKTVTIFIIRISRCERNDGQNCHENARCVQIDDSTNHRCECEAGYRGDGYSCEDIDDCSSNPCNGNGQCVDEVNNYACICNNGFSGPNCDIVEKDLTNACTSKPCKNGAVCVPDPKNKLAYSCSCKNGWHGSKCDASVDDCEKSQCNGGQCVDKHLTYICKCPDNKQSFRCQYDPTVCKDTSKCGGDGDSVCIPKINRNDNACAKKGEDIVTLQIKKPESSSDNEELKAQVYDTIMALIRAYGNKQSSRRRKRSEPVVPQVYIVSVTDADNGLVDVEFVVMDPEATEGVYSKEEVLDMLNTRCKDIEADNLSESQVCPAVQKATSTPTPAPQVAEAGLPIPIIAGAAGGAILVIVLIVVVVCVRKRKGSVVDPQKKNLAKDEDSETGSRRSSGYSSISKSPGNQKSDAEQSLPGNVG